MPEPTPWRVSAVVPTYNRADLLPETIASIRAQRPAPAEIVVVDDGSTDDTREVVRGLGADIRYVRIANSGAPVARNVGAALATGDWLWFCDSDDLWRPEYLDRCRRIATTAPFPEFIFGNFRIVRNGAWSGTSKFAAAPAGFWESIPREPAPGGAVVTEPLYGALLRFQPIFHSTIVMTRRLFHEVGGYDPAFARTGSEDFEFTLRCASHAPLGMVDEPLVGVRRHERNFSNDHLRELLGEVEILRHALTRHPAAAGHAAAIRAEIARRTLAALTVAFSADDYEGVSSLARRLDRSQIDARAGVKIFLAGLPSAIRDPVISLARLKNGRPARP